MDKVKELPEFERPYEKCEKFGAEILTDAELLAVVMRTGTVGMSSLTVAKELLKACPEGSSIAGLDAMTVEELTGIRGVGKVKAIQIKCMSEFSKRMWRYRHSRKIYRNTEDIAQYYMEHLRYLGHEEVYIMLLDNRCGFLGDFRLSSGTVDCSPVSVRDIFMNALKRGAVKIAMVHNHPSGNPAPSSADVGITKKIHEAGMLLGITLVDSIIIGDGNYVSLFNKAASY